MALEIEVKKAKAWPKKPSDGAKTYRIKDGAPDHYFPFYGIVKAGAIIKYDGEPGAWLEEVVPDKPRLGRPPKAENTSE